MALHAVGLTAPEKGSSALVVGAGMIGLLILQSLRVAGCGDIFVTDIDAARLQLAKKLGATETIEASAATTSEEIAEQVRGKTGRHGVDVVLEAVGSAATVRTAIVLGEKEWKSDPGWKSRARSAAAAATGRHPPASTAGLMCLCRRIPAGDRIDGQ